MSGGRFARVQARRGGGAVAALVLALTAPAAAVAQERTFGDVVREVTSRPEYRHSEFGVAIWDLDANRLLYGLNEQRLFTPASTTKLVTEGTALKLLGPDYRFHTKVYRTGPVEGGVLKGDLVLVASGDPNLSNRIQPDGTLAFTDEDHAYDGNVDTKAVPGDPLAVLRELAQHVAGKGIRRVTGHVRVDASLFPEGAKDLGTGLTISPIEVNDNVVDVSIAPGAAVGAPVTLQVSPATAYVRFVNQATTSVADSAAEIHWASDVANADGSHTVTVTGHMPLGKPTILFAYGVPDATRFAEVAFAQALRDAGVQATPPSPAAGGVALTKQVAAPYVEGDVVAEHVSPPLSEDVKVTLKVSQNLHASTMPYVVGAVLAHKREDAEQAGFDLERDFLTRAGLDLSGAGQGDGAGGAQSAFFTPDFMVHYLAYMATQPEYPLFLKALPILGVDGTLWNIQTASPAKGHVFAKTGTFTAWDNLNKRSLLTGKGLAGYITTADGHHVAFALYANRVPLTPELKGGATWVGQALGEIAAAAYLLPIR
ncbi:MAG TPA: D-alanyl-D-alanine carboxypeptidase/D-alanyl-D-alanine-endopeptidase [Longimicrobiales bacterium]